MTNYDALAQALVLAVTAPTDEQVGAGLSRLGLTARVEDVSKRIGHGSDILDGLSEPAATVQP